MLETTHTTTPLVYVECDVPEGMTLGEWRRSRCARRVSRRERVVLAAQRVRHPRRMQAASA